MEETVLTFSDIAREEDEAYYDIKEVSYVFLDQF
jgi:hypothetical protein